ncbi:hypothetical protein ISS03_00150 [Patescibacteria group bacterium]|nr:hypothetical protein [Patescibacteria group bacterium]
MFNKIPTNKSPLQSNPIEDNVVTTNRSDTLEFGESLRKMDELSKKKIEKIITSMLEECQTKEDIQNIMKSLVDTGEIDTIEYKELLLLINSDTPDKDLFTIGINKITNLPDSVRFNFVSAFHRISQNIDAKSKTKQEIKDNIKRLFILTENEYEREILIARGFTEYQVNEIVNIEKSAWNTLYNKLMEQIDLLKEENINNIIINIYSFLKRKNKKISEVWKGVAMHTSEY